MMVQLARCHSIPSGALSKALPLTPALMGRNILMGGFNGLVTNCYQPYICMLDKSVCLRFGLVKVNQINYKCYLMHGDSNQDIDDTSVSFMHIGGEGGSIW